MTASTRDVCDFLDRTLRTAEFDDVSHNGLQVANSGRVSRVCCAVDASLESIGAALQRKADLLVCHHGLSWGDSLARITGMNYGRLRELMTHDMALYACHLPLDAHPRLGNNAGLCRALGLKRLTPFGLYRGRKIGFEGRLARPLPFKAFETLVARAVGGPVRSIEFGKPLVRRVAVVSGGAADETPEAGEAGVDAFVTGESSLPAYHAAREHGVHVVYAGHYATETFGVRALAGLLRRKFGLRAEFLDLRTPW